MRPGREIDSAIAQEVLKYPIKIKKKELWEVTDQGERPLRKYSKDIGAAWEVIEKMNITMIPIENGQWFALVGTGRPWTNPAEFLSYVQSGQFVRAGAAVGQEPAMTACLAALKAIRTDAVMSSGMTEAGTEVSRENLELIEKMDEVQTLPH